MNIDKVRNYIIDNKNKELNFKYSGTRGFNEEFSGIITNVYTGVFLIKTNDNGRIRSFSYSDILIGNLEILDC